MLLFKQIWFGVWGCPVETLEYEACHENLRMKSQKQSISLLARILKVGRVWGKHREDGVIRIDLQMVETRSSVKETPSDSQPELPTGPKDGSGSPAGALLGSSSHQGVGF